MPLLPRELLNHRYRIHSLLADGSYGAVYRALDIKSDTDVAIREYLDTSSETRRLFRAEAGRLAGIKHPQLPEVLDYFALEEVGQYLVSEYIDGADLSQLLSQYGRLPSDLIISWLQAACRPLAFLHKKGQLHLNIKPSNLRIIPSGDLFLVDTGLPGLGVTLGKSGYVSPEHQTQTDITVASDIYSMGATLYTLLTNQLPPDALHRESGLVDLIPARELNPDVDPYLSVVANRAMDLRPDVRYQSAKEFAKALERQTSLSAAPPSNKRRSEKKVIAAPAPRLPGQRRRQIESRTIVGLSIILFLIIGVFIGLALANRSPEQQAAQAGATATLRSQVVAALTAITTVTPSPAPSATPIPTPPPLEDKKTGARMIFVPSGIFRMGEDEGEEDEAPSHVIRVDAYFLDQYEVTNGQYALCVNDGACSPPDRPGATLHPAYYGDSGYDNYPVINVSWFDARDFCRWRDVRLPTEAEWERAAGFDPAQGLKYVYPWGDLFDGRALNYCDVNCVREDRDTEYDDGHGDTAPVGSYLDGVSPLGFYDMAGNVMEWVNDWYDPRYYSFATDTNPLGPLEGEFKVLRGGSWLSTSDDVRVSGRSSFEPTVSRANLGFRCAVSAQ